MAESYGYFGEVKNVQQQQPKRQLYTTELIETIRQDMLMGYQVDTTPFFPYDNDLRAPGIVFKMTEEEYAEFERCYNDPDYFIEKYCKFLTDNGRKTVKLRPYQHDIVNMVCSQHFDPEINEMVPDNGKICLLASRQIGKTTTTAAYITWYICFHTDRNVGIMANKQDTAIEIVAKVKDMIRGLPYFLMPGVERWGEKGCAFDNGCKIISSATTKSASIGFTVNGILYLDEFAHIEPSICDNFWRSVYPTLSSSKTAQLIVSSTPNGVDNRFAKIWFGHLNGENSFAGLRVDYWMVPGHDEKWAEQQKADFGEEFFNQEFLLQFSSSSSSLLRGKDFEFLHRVSGEFETKHIMKDSMYMDDPHLQWRKDFDPNNISEKDHFLFLMDTAEGNGDLQMLAKENKKSPDANTFSIFKIVPNSIANLRRFKETGLSFADAYRFVQVGRFSRNDVDETYLANIASEVALDLFNALEYDNVRMMLEMNFEGKSALKSIMNHPRFFDELVVKTYHTAPIPGERPPLKKFGFLTNSTKKAFCLKGKDLFAKRRIVVTDNQSNEQLKAFGWVNGKLKGVAMHDDLSFPIVHHIARFLDDDGCIQWLEDYFYYMQQKGLYTKDYCDGILEMLRKYSPQDSGMTEDDIREMYGSAGLIEGNGSSLFPDTGGLSPYSSGGFMNPYTNSGEMSWIR